MIISLSVIFLPTSSPTDVRITSVGFTFIGDSPFRRYIGRKNKKQFPDGFTDGICAQKKDSRLKYTDGFLFRQ